MPKAKPAPQKGVRKTFARFCLGNRFFTEHIEIEVKKRDIGLAVNKLRADNDGDIPPGIIAVDFHD